VSRPHLADKFRAVTADRLARLRSAVPALPADASQRPVIARELHTIKGEAQLVGFAAVARVARRLEEILGDGDLAPEGVAELRRGLEVIDAIRLLALDDAEGAALADAFCGTTGAAQQ
jgi:chemotaxis protein histidine kinase CheA